MARIFVYDGREFPDPDPKLPADEVRKQLSEFFPELANAETREEKRGEDTAYTFSKRIGTKGRRRVDVVGILRRVAAKRLAVLDLAEALLDGEGELDLEAAASKAPEVNFAVAEVEAYIGATRLAVEALRKLPAR